MKSIRTIELERWFKDMTVEDAIRILLNHNKWMRGDDTIKMCSPTQLWIAIEKCCEALEKRGEN